MHLSLVDWITVVALGIVALGLAARDALSENSSLAKYLPALFRSRLWSYVPLIAFVFALVLYIPRHWDDNAGFNAGWPDAIRCDGRQPDQTANDRKSQFIYTFNGLRFSRRNIGDVAGYSLAGSYNKDGKYSPHEIWFSLATRRMIVPEDLKAAGSLDSLEEFYVDWFPNGDCGGNDMDSIVSAGRAFTFAQKMK